MSFYHCVEPGSEGKPVCVEKGRFGMNTIVRALGLGIVMSACIVMSGCASQPIALGADTQANLAAQTELRTHSQTLNALIDDEGWSLSAAPAAAARAFFGRLINGASEQAPQDDPVSVYVDAHDHMMVQSLNSDLGQLINLTRAIADAAEDIAAADHQLGQVSLTQDLALAESALGSVRRAQDFFTAVSDRLDDEGALSGHEPLMQTLDAEKSRLANAADALAERRWAMHSNRGLAS